MAIYNAACKKAMLNNNGLAELLTAVAAGATAGTGTGRLFIFGGTVPVDADTALDMSGTHTLLGTVTSDAGVTLTGTNGLSFAAATSSGSPAVAVLAKNSGETWSTGNMTFTGHITSGTVTATFARFSTEAAAAVEGAGSTTARAQLTIAQLGDPAADINLTSTAFASGTNFTLSSFQIQG